MGTPPPLSVWDRAGYTMFSLISLILSYRLQCALCIFIFYNTHCNTYCTFCQPLFQYNFNLSSNSIFSLTPFHSAIIKLSMIRQCALQRTAGTIMEPTTVFTVKDVDESFQIRNC